MLRFAAFLLVLLLANCQLLDFSSWCIAYGKTYATLDERAYRQQVFLQTKALVAAHNSNLTATFQMNLTQFADMTPAEFAAAYLTMQPQPVDTTTPFLNLSSSRRLLQSSSNIDWQSLNMTSPVKNMLNCGCSWAFAGSGSMESASMIYGNTSWVMADQQVLDCGSGNCSVGLAVYALGWSRTNGVQNSTGYFNYTGTKASTCRKNNGTYKVSTYYQLYSGCDNFTAALQVGPFPVFLDGTNWQNYQSGIVDNCGGNAGNFYALLVGVSDTYWKIKNAFGTIWGESGYIRLAPGNTCYICDTNSYMPQV